MIEQKTLIENLELFPEIAREAKRNRKHKQRARVVCAKIRLADDENGMQKFIIGALVKLGISCLLGLWWELDELCEGAEETVIEESRLLLTMTAWNMYKAGVLWMHDWGCGECVFGIKGVHNKAEMLRKAREAAE